MYGATNYEAAPPKAALELNRKERRAARSKQRRQK